jgi:hypothetical protein
VIDNNHISETDLLAFQQDRMNQKAKEKFLEHICSCDYCSEQLATLMTGEMLSAPRDMKTNILNATRRPEVQFAIKAKETSKRMQLLIYSLKVGTATVGALLLLLLTMNFTDFSTASSIPKDITTDEATSDEDKVSLTTTIRDNMDKISNSMLDFSNNIMKTEVLNNDQKEK